MFRCLFSDPLNWKVLFPFIIPWSVYLANFKRKKKKKTVKENIEKQDDSSRPAVPDATYAKMHTNRSMRKTKHRLLNLYHILWLTVAHFESGMIFCPRFRNSISSKYPIEISSCLLYCM